MRKMKTKLIGKRRKKRLEELARMADNDPLINEIIKGKPVEKNRVYKFGLEPCDQAAELIERVETEIGFERFGMLRRKLIRASINSDNVKLSDNALLAVAYAGLKRREDAEMLIDDIKYHFGTKEKTVFDALSRAFAYAYMGRGDTRKRIENIETNCMQKDGFVSEIDFSVFTYNNALLALDYSLLRMDKKADNLLEKTRSRLMSDDDPSLFCHRLDQKHTSLSASTLMSLAYFAQGKDGSGLIEEVEKYILDISYEIFQGITNRDVAMAIAYMAREHYRKNEK